MTERNVNFSSKPGVYTILFVEEQVCMKIDRLNELRGAVNAEIRIETTLPGVTHEQHLHHASYNLLSTRGRAEIARKLGERANTHNWDEMIDYASMLALDSYREGEPLEVITSDDDIEMPHYLAYPLLPQGHPTVMFGEGGAGKSRLALYVASCLITEWIDNPLKLGVKTGCNVLYLDWETTRPEITREYKRICKGGKRPESRLYYRRCSRPLSNDLPEISRIVEGDNIGLVIIDSIGPAVSGDLNLNEGATQLMGRDLRQLNVTSLCLGHTSKGENNKRTVFGSVFFQNLARAVWEVKKVQDTGVNHMSVGLFCRKANMSQMFQPLGMEVSFTDDCINIERQQIKDVPELAKGLSLVDQIAYVLRHGTMNKTEISEEIDANPESVKTVCNRRKDRFVKVGDKWGLKDNHELP